MSENQLRYYIDYYLRNTLLYYMYDGGCIIADPSPALTHSLTHRSWVEVICVVNIIMFRPVEAHKSTEALRKEGGVVQRMFDLFV